MKVFDLNPFQRVVTQEQQSNLEELARRITLLEELMEEEFWVSSGFRSKMDQLRVNPRSPDSAHTHGLAVDLYDTNGLIYDFLVNNTDMVIKLDFYIELKTYTPKYIHIQIRPTKSGTRFFKPW